jgi:hypothetical protein
MENRFEERYKTGDTPWDHGERRGRPHTGRPHVLRGCGQLVISSACLAKKDCFVQRIGIFHAPSVAVGPADTSRSGPAVTTAYLCKGFAE